MSEPRLAVRAETDRFFREIVLCLGGIFAIHEVDDALVWRVTKSLEHLYHRSRERLGQRPGKPARDPFSRRLTPHPAVEDLLARIGA